MTQLFDAFRRVIAKDQGVIFIDGHKVYHHWVEPENTVNLEMTGICDVAFVDQEVRFDEHGITQVADTKGRSREIRILVMVPFNSLFQTIELIDSPTSDAA